MTLGDLVDRLPRIQLVAGAALDSGDGARAELLVVCDGLVVIRTAVPG
jgi:hypothetical protein